MFFRFEKKVCATYRFQLCQFVTPFLNCTSSFNPFPNVLNMLQPQLGTGPVFLISDGLLTYSCISRDIVKTGGFKISLTVLVLFWLPTLCSVMLLHLCGYWKPQAFQTALSTLILTSPLLAFYWQLHISPLLCFPNKEQAGNDSGKHNYHCLSNLLQVRVLSPQQWGTFSILTIRHNSY